MHLLLLSAVMVGLVGINPTEGYPVPQVGQQGTSGSAAGGFPGSAGGTFGYPGFGMPVFGAVLPAQFPFAQPGSAGFPFFAGFPGMGNAGLPNQSGSFSFAGSQSGSGATGSGSGSSASSSSQSVGQQHQPEHGVIGTGSSGTSHAEQQPSQGHINTSSGAGSSSQGQTNHGHGHGHGAQSASGAGAQSQSSGGHGSSSGAQSAGSSFGNGGRHTEANFGGASGDGFGVRISVDESEDGTVKKAQSEAWVWKS